MKRLFAAISTIPDEGFISGYRNLKDALHPHKIKWVEEENLHITLKFFGETSEARIPDICRVVNSVAAELPQFSFNYEGLGVFGSSYNPRVIWAGIRPYDQVSQMIMTLKHELATIGFPADRQNPVPHLTLGRIRSLQDRVAFQKDLDSKKKISSGPMKAEKIVLFESILQPTGPKYLVIDSFPLKK
ncbi:MAG: RNA 2',3'-cyclic phosphodiesterase [Bacteroidales bacterium]|nr:RNA 2',3'-cyclic phosphodiesterase [Bacteroidales bacterium]